MIISRRFLAATKNPNGRVFIVAADKIEFLHYMQNSARVLKELLTDTDPADRFTRTYQCVFLTTVKSKLLL